MKKRKILALILALAMILALALAGCGDNNAAADNSGTASAANTAKDDGKDAAKAEDGKYSFQVRSGSTGGENSAQYLLSTPMLDKALADLSNEVLGYDAFDVTYSIGGALGSTEGDYIDAVYSGLLEQYTAPVANMFEYDGNNLHWNIFDMPLIFKGDSDVFNSFARGDIAKQIYADYEAKNSQVVVNAASPQGWNTLGVNLKKDVDKITSIGELKGLKIRVVASPILEGMVKSLSSSPVNVAYAELYTAVMQGTIDGLIVNSNALAAGRLHEVCPHVIHYGLSAAGHVSFVNKSWLDSLPEELHDGVYEIMTTEMADMYAASWELCTAYFDQQMIDAGALEEPSDELVAEIEEAMSGLPMELADSCGGTEYVQSVIDWVDEHGTDCYASNKWLNWEDNPYLDM